MERTTGCKMGHRVEAARRVGRKAIAAEVLPGTLAEMEDEFREHMRKMFKLFAKEAAEHENNRKRERK